MKAEHFRKQFFEATPRYKWLETLGRGGVGIVFKALDLELEDIVAIKVLSPDVDRDDQALLQRFKREINLNRRIKHPNVARIHDFGLAGDFPYITMEFIPGKDLWTIIQNRKRLPPGEAVSILRQIARGSEAVHRLGIVHRDLKSQNVIVDDSGAVAIVDFGLARGKANENFTLDSIILGTPHYMSPEQAGGKEVDARSDIYSIGVIAFEVLTGHPPFNAPSPLAVALKHISEPVPDDLAHVPDVSPELRALVMKALEKDPSNRFPSAAELETCLGMLQPAAVSPPVLLGSHKALWAPADALLADLETALNSIVMRVPHDGELYEEAVEVDEGRLGPPTTVVSRRAPAVLLVSAQKDVPSLSAGLRAAGLTPLVARTGQDAIETLLRRRVQVVVMDVDLPGMDGIDVTRVIKSQPQFGSLPILLVTPRPDRSQLAFAIQSGATDLLGRPLLPDPLAARLWQVLHHLGYSLPPDQEEVVSDVRPASRPRHR